MENQKSQTEKWYESLTAKIVILGFLGLVLLIPLALIQEVIRERSSYADEARMEIGRLWASRQTITGPVLNVPGQKIISVDGKIITTTLHILPENLIIDSKISPEIRYRGIYETVVYDSEIEMSGEFILSGFTTLDGYTYDWTKAYVSLGVSDNRGLKDEVILSLAGKSIDAQPGPGQSDLFERGISFPSAIDISAEPFDGKFLLNFGLKGSEGMYFAPTGKTTKVKLSSAWSSPSFQGTFLPNERTVTPEGFTAEWVVTHLNRNFPQAWTGGGYTPENEAFGADMMLEVDHYKKTERSAKYGLLFIVLTFFVLVLIEVRSSEKIHIFYYVLVALALIMFFSLLSALSEHTGFNPAYLISSVATIALLTAFFRSLLSKRWVVLLVSGLLATLYTFIFILLALKDYAYLAGNIGFFILLGVLMMLSSKYRLFSEKSKD